MDDWFRSQRKLKKNTIKALDTGTSLRWTGRLQCNFVKKKNSYCLTNGQWLVVLKRIRDKITFGTDSTKINRPVHNIRTYWTNFRQPTAHVQQNIFAKTPIEVCSSHLYASFGTFYAKIGQLLEAQWVFEIGTYVDSGQ